MRHGKKTIVFVVFWLLLLGATGAFAAVVGKFTAIEGNIDLTRPGKAAVAVKVGDSVAVGDFIRTKSRSRGEITYVDGNIVRLAESSRIRITEYSPDKNRQTLDLFRGKIHAAVKTAAEVTGTTRGGAFEVRTPTAVAGVRGTLFFVYHQQGVSGVAFQEGTGYGYSRQFPQEVRSIGPGVVMLVTRPDALPILRPALPNEMERHQQDTTPAKRPAEERKTQETPGAPVIYVLPEAAPGETAPPVLLTPAPAPALRPPEPVPVVPPGDTTPPFIKEHQLPPPVSGEYTTRFRFGTNEPARISFQLDGGSWFGGPAAPLDTDFVIDLHGLTEGTRRLDLVFADGAGNVSRSYYKWFIGSRRYLLEGAVGGALAGGVSSASEGLRLVSLPGRSGAWMIEMQGTGSVPAGVFNATAGGRSYVTTSASVWDGYWLSRLTGENFAGALRGGSFFTYLSPQVLGSGSGVLTGSLTTGGWQLRDLGLGTYQETPLFFGSAVGVLERHGFQYFDGTSYQPDSVITRMTGLMGGTGNLWAGPVPFQMMGLYANPNDRRFWVMDLVWKDLDLTATADPCLFNIACQRLSTSGPGFAGVGYQGMLVGLARGNKLWGEGTAIYIKHSEGNETGYFVFADITGDFYPGTGYENKHLWAASGQVQTFAKGTTSITPVELYDGSPSLELDSFDITVGGGGITGMLQGESLRLTDQKWGILVAGLRGNYTSALTSGSWQTQWGRRKASGTDGTSYLLGTSSGPAWDAATNTLQGTLTGREIRVASLDSYLGNVSGRLRGIYSEGILEGAVTGAYHNWPLSFGGVLDGKFHQYSGFESGSIAELGTWEGNWGALDPFGNQGVTAHAIGRYEKTASTPLFTGEIRSYLTLESTLHPVGSQKVMATGFIGGRVFANNLTSEGLAVYYRNVGTEANPNYEVGYLVYRPTGVYYPDLVIERIDNRDFSMWGAEGTARGLTMATPPMSHMPQVAAAPWEPLRSYSPPLGDLTQEGLKLHASLFRKNALQTASGNDMDWGVWQRLSGGSWESPFTHPSTGEKMVTAAWKTMSTSPHSADLEYWLTEGNWKADQTITGKTLAAAAMANLDAPPRTVIAGGDLKGIFDPTNSTWQTVATGAYMETTRFLGMARAHDNAGRDTLAALGIPAVQVGVATLSQASGTTVNNVSNLTMNNVGFFAYATGQAPKIWATDLVSGTYTGTPNTTTPIPLTGGGLTANFTFNSWQPGSTGPGAWGAQVSGGGSLNDGTLPVNFQGAAAGHIHPYLNLSPGTFSGTAAGIVLPPE